MTKNLLKRHRACRLVCLSGLTYTQVHIGYRPNHVILLPCEVFVPGRTGSDVGLVLVPVEMHLALIFTSCLGAVNAVYGTTHLPLAGWLRWKRLADTNIDVGSVPQVVFLVIVVGEAIGAAPEVALVLVSVETAVGAGAP